VEVELVLELEFELVVVVDEDEEAPPEPLGSGVTTVPPQARRGMEKRARKGREARCIRNLRGEVSSPEDT